MTVNILPTCNLFGFFVPSVDATYNDGRPGRLVNHSRMKKLANVNTKIVDVEGTPHLYLIAGRDIKPGEKLLYDYGDRSKDAVQSHPWLSS